MRGKHNVPRTGSAVSWLMSSPVDLPDYGAPVVSLEGRGREPYRLNVRRRVLQERGSKRQANRVGIKSRCQLSPPLKVWYLLDTSYQARILDEFRRTGVQRTQISINASGLCLILENQSHCLLIRELPRHKSTLTIYVSRVAALIVHANPEVEN